MNDGGPRSCLETHLGDVVELRDLRTHVGDLAAASGFGRHARRRAVLAVHEAAALACRLLADGSRRDRCSVHLEVGPALLVAEIDLPRSIPFPADLRDHDPLRYVRAFAPDTGWTGTLAARRLRVAARDDR